MGKVIDLTARFSNKAGFSDPEAVSDEFTPIVVILPDEMARVVEAAIKLRRSKGDLPGPPMDRKEFGTVITNYERGRALYDICAEYILDEQRNSQDQFGDGLP